MAISLFAPALIAGAFAAVGIALAPVASADDFGSLAESVESADAAQRGPNKADVKKRPGPNAGSNDYSSSQIPQGWRNDAVWANPSKSGSSPFGSAKRPPVIALD
jgi:hypothetical protein